jgi:hypothetical protein
MDEVDIGEDAGAKIEKTAFQITQRAHSNGFRGI